MRTLRTLLPLALLLVTLTLLLAACGGSSASGSGPNGGTSGGGNLPTVTQDTCANTLPLAQASAIVGEVTRVDALVTASSDSVLCTYYASNGGASLSLDIYYSANPQNLYNTVQAGYQHLMTLSGYGDAAMVGYQDHFPVYTMFLVKGHTYVFIQSTDDNLDSSLAQVKAVALAILPKLV